MAAGISPELSWHFGFGMAAVGMFFGIVQYLGGWKHLGNAGMDPVLPESDAARVRQRRQLQLGIAAVIAIVGLLVALSRSGIIHISAQGLGNAFGVLLLLITVAFFFWLLVLAQWTPAERKRLVVVLVLFLAATVFWSVFEQQGSSLNLFAQRNTDTRIFGASVPVQLVPVSGIGFPRSARPCARLGLDPPGQARPVELGEIRDWSVLRRGGVRCPLSRFAVRAGRPQGEPALADGHVLLVQPSVSCFSVPWA